MRYLIDENLPPTLLEGIAVNDVEIPYVSLRTLYPANTKDEQWIRDIRTEDVVVLSLDTKMAHYRIHRSDLEANNITIVFLPKSRFQYRRAIEQKAWISLHFHRVHAFVTELSQPTGVSVTATGNSKILWTVGDPL